MSPFGLVNLENVFGADREQDIFDLRGIDSYAGQAVLITHQLFDDHSAERVADQDRLVRHGFQYLRVVIGDVLDPVASDAVRRLAGFPNCRLIAGPSRRCRAVAVGRKTLDPGFPRGGVQP